MTERVRKSWHSGPHKRTGKPPGRPRSYTCPRCKLKPRVYPDAYCIDCRQAFDRARRPSRAALLLALLLCSCGGKLDGWDPPPGATEVELAALSSALESWCDATGGQQCDALVEGGVNRFQIADLGSVRRAGNCKVDFPPVGDKRSVVTIDIRRERDDWPEFLRAVAMHELGHHNRESEGHLAAPVGVMHHCVDIGLRIGHVTPDDVTGELVGGTVDCDDWRVE